jgi:DNA-directed RNA polymerase subunit RPC12/RpoP
MKCSFCEQPLCCKRCGKPFQPRQRSALTAIYQPDMQVACPECQAVLACKWCGYVYGDPDADSESE